jgi:hypothetical protein
MFMSQISLYKLLFEQDLTADIASATKASTKGTEDVLKKTFEPFEKKIEDKLGKVEKYITTLMKDTKTPKQDPTKAAATTGTTIPTTATKPTDVGTGPATPPKSQSTTSTANNDSESIAKSISKSMLTDPRFIGDLADKISKEKEKK